MLLFAIIVGFILDLLIGDPRWLPHPICLIGNLISFLEKLLRSIFGKSSRGLLVGGAVLVILVLAFSFCVPFLVLALAEKINPWLAFAVESFMCYQIFATRCLREESMKVYTALKNNDLTDARMKLSWIVGRDTKELTKSEVTKGAVETVAENTADGIIAPMLYMFIGGAPLAFLYKGINTMDSMVGYKNDRYINFGRTAARLDDGCNYIPARLSAFFMIAAGFLLEAAEGAGRRLKKGDEAGIRHYSGTGGIRIFKRDRYNHKSPNSAQTESVCAGVLGIRLAGNACYFGRLYEKPTIGDADRPVEYADIRRANALMTGTYAAALFVTAVIGFFLFV